jgi:hypothetical protein
MSFDSAPNEYHTYELEDIKLNTHSSVKPPIYPTAKYTYKNVTSDSIYIVASTVDRKTLLHCLQTGKTYPMLPENQLVGWSVEINTQRITP